MAPVRNPRPSGRECDEGRAVARAPRQDLGDVVAGPEGKLRLHGGDGMNRRNRLELRDRWLRDPERAHLSVGDETGHRTPGLGGRNLRIDPVQIVEVDLVDAEPPERVLARGADVLGPAVAAVAVGRRVLDDVSDFRREDDPFAQPRERAADEGLVRERAVHVGRIEVIDSQIDGAADQIHPRGRVDRRVVIPPRQPHAAEADREDAPAVRPQRPALHGRTIHPGGAGEMMPR